jgi:Domain of unknown function (DUF3850)
MLLFIKKRFYDAILSRSKTFEIRCGSRYRNVRAGDILLLNSRLRVQVARRELHPSAESLVRAGLCTQLDIDDCYPNAIAPFYVFHLSHEITPPPEAQLRLDS